jgi:Tol biopolymer transport system component
MAPALLALSAAGCGFEGGSALTAQEAAGGDPEVVVRRVWDNRDHAPGGNGFLSVAPDLSYVAFQRYDESRNPRLAVEDQSSREVRDLTSGAVRYGANYPTRISPDGEWIAFHSADPSGVEWELKVIRKDGTGERTLRMHGTGLGGGWHEVFDWSSDSRKILAVVWMPDETTRLELISREDGSRLILKALGWRAPLGARLSPDRRFVAYDLPPDESDGSRDLYVLSVDGSREVRLTEDADNKEVIGWSRDGSAIYYAVHVSERGQNITSIWRLPMRESRPAGAPTLVRADLVGVRAGSLTYLPFNGERLLYDVRTGGSAFWSVTVDLESGRVVVPPAIIAHYEFTGMVPHSGWTPDGLEFVYFRPGWEMVLQSPTSGEERAIPTGLSYPDGGLMAWDATTMYVGGQTRRGQRAIVRVDLPTGRATPVEDPSALERLNPASDPPLPEPNEVRPMRSGRFSRDRSVEYLTQQRGGAYDVVARNVATGAERVLHRESTRTLDPVLSPDGTHLAFLVFSADTPEPGAPVRPGDPGSNALHVLPVAGGVSRVVHTGWIGGNSINWSSAGRTLVFNSRSAPGAPEIGLWKVGVDGTGKALLLSQPTGLGTPRLSPDDRRIVYRGPAGTPISELWVIDNLVESRPGYRSAASSR